jgi:hypothetical protein
MLILIEWGRTHSTAAHLSNQMGTDLREAETASHHYNSSNTRAMRIHSEQGNSLSQNPLKSPPT